jgi:Holliday junction resolvase-like predicted endonuclease
MVNGAGPIEHCHSSAPVRRFGTVNTHRLGHHFKDAAARILEALGCSVVARWWIERHCSPELRYRFDVVRIRLDIHGRLTVEHMENAWRPG